MCNDLMYQNENLAYENKKMGDFLSLLGFSPSDVDDLIICNIDGNKYLKALELVNTRERFMSFFRSDSYGELTTVEDGIEIFRTCLHGSTDLTLPLLREIVSDYCADLELSDV